MRSFPMNNTPAVNAGNHGAGTAADDLIWYLDGLLVCGILLAGIAIQFSLSFQTNNKVRPALVVNAFWLIATAYLILAVSLSERYATRGWYAGVPAAVLLTSSRGLRILVNARGLPEASRTWLIGNAYVTNGVQVTRTYSALLTGVVLTRMVQGLPCWVKVTCVAVPELARVGMTFHAVHRMGGWGVVEDAVPHTVFADSITFAAGAYFSSLEL